MKKSELIAKLQEIEGDPVVFVTSAYGERCILEEVDHLHVFDAKYPTHTSKRQSVEVQKKWNYTGFDVVGDPYYVIYLSGYTTDD